MPSDPTDSGQRDILVSANDQGDVFQIDTTTGNATKIGSYGTIAAGKVISSGDLIGVRGFGIYATVDVGTEPQRLPREDRSGEQLEGDADRHRHRLRQHLRPRLLGRQDLRLRRRRDRRDTGKIIQIDPEHRREHGADRRARVRWYGAGVATNAPIIQ